MSKITQCWSCYKIRDNQEDESVWNKAQGAAALSRNSHLTVCPDCESKFRKLWGLDIQIEEERKVA
jgi:hypothetical protein